LVGENKSFEPKQREFLMVKGDCDAFVEAITERLKDQRSLKAMHHSDGMWAAYFEGEAQGKVSLAVVDDGNEEVCAPCRIVGTKPCVWALHSNALRLGASQHDSPCPLDYLNT
jgi:hypothetical protein